MENKISKLIIISSVILGIFFIISQTLLIREYLVVFNGNEYTLGIYFFTYFLWIGIGGLLTAFLMRRIILNLNHYILLTNLLPFFLILQIFLIRISRIILGVPGSEIIGLDKFLFITLIINLPLSLCTGIIIPCICKIFDQFKDKFITYIYVFEALGCLLGGIGLTYILLPYLSIRTNIVIISSLILVFDIIYLYLYRLIIKTKLHSNNLIPERLALKKTYPAAGILIICIVFLLIFFPDKNVLKISAALRWNSISEQLQLLESIETKYQHIDIGKYGNQFSVYTNGMIDYSFPEKYEIPNIAALYMTQKINSKKLLLIGSGYSGLIPELLKYPVKELSYTEPDKKYLDKLKKYFSEDTNFIFNNNRFKLIYQEGAAFVNNSNKKNLYDMIIVDVGDPNNLFINRYYTLEFYKKIWDILKIDGVFITKISSDINYAGKDIKEYNFSVYATLKQIFSNIDIVPGQEHIFICSNTNNISTDFNILKKRYAKFNFKDTFVRTKILESILDPYRVNLVKNLYKNAEGKINTSSVPATYLYSLKLWSNFSNPAVSQIINSLQQVQFKHIILFFFSLLLCRFIFLKTCFEKNSITKFNSFSIIFISGFISFTFQLIIMLKFQSVYGFIYHKAGLLNGSFMAGLAAGGFIISLFKNSQFKSKLLVLLLLLYFFFMVFINTNFIRNIYYSEFYFYLISFISAFFSGSIYASSVSAHWNTNKDAGSTSARLEFSDHTGAAIGSLTAGLIFIPVIGTIMSVYILSILLFIAILLFLIPAFLHKLHFYKLTHFKINKFLNCSLWIFVVVCLFYFIIIFPIKDKVSVLAKKNRTLFLTNDIIKTQKAVSKTELLSLEKYISLGNYKVIKVGSPLSYYKVYDNDKLKEYIFDSAEITGKVRGYIADISFLLIIKPDGVIEKIIFTKFNENPFYVQDIDIFLNSVNGKKIDAEFNLKNKNIDSITGATITVNIILEIITDIKNKIAKAGLFNTVKLDDNLSDSKISVKNRDFVNDKYSNIPRGRKVDFDKIKSLIESGLLSDKEALFYSEPDKNNIKEH